MIKSVANKKYQKNLNLFCIEKWKTESEDFRQHLRVYRLFGMTMNLLLR